LLVHKVWSASPHFTEDIGGEGDVEHNYVITTLSRVRVRVRVRVRDTIYGGLVGLTVDC